MINEIKKRLSSYHLADSSYQPVDSGNKVERELAAVLLPIVMRERPALILTQRSSKLDAHGGEVAWPGGKKDESDESLVFTALRESEEEIGLRPGLVEIVCQLRPFISKFGLEVTPFVGLIPAGVELVSNDDEISSIFQVPLDYLLDDPRTDTDIIERHGERHVVPVYHYEGFKIWGLTAMILLEFMVHGLGLDITDR